MVAVSCLMTLFPPFSRGEDIVVPLPSERGASNLSVDGDGPIFFSV